MKTISLISMSLVLATAACAVDPASSSSEPGERASLDAALSAAAPVWPPKVDVPIGASDDVVCKQNDGDVRAQFEAYVKSKGGTIVKPSPDVSKWPRESSRPVCRYCDLDGMHINVPPGVSEPRIIDSTARNATINAERSIKLSLDNVYARDARLSWDERSGAIELVAHSTDLRCGGLGSTELRVSEAVDVDLSATEGFLALSGKISNTRLTGVNLALRMSNATVNDLRLDGAFNISAKISSSTIGGTTRLDGSRVDLQMEKVTFSGGAIMMKNAHGRMRPTGVGVTFDKVEMPDTDGGVVIPPELLGAVHIVPGTSWPVGSHVIVSDSQLTKLNLTGAKLVAHDATWPTVPRLDGLVLTNGALPAKADLTATTFEGARLENVDLRNVTISKSENGVTKGAHLAHANLQGAKLNGSAIDGVDFSLADLRGAHLDSVHGSASFTQAQAGALPAHFGINDTAQHMETSFTDAKLGTSVFTEAGLQYARFDGAKLAKARFDKAHIDFAHFSRATFVEDGVASTSLAAVSSARAVDFSGADLRGVSLVDIDVRPLADDANTVQRAMFGGALLCGGDLSGAKLGGANLSGLLFDVVGQVKMPDGSMAACTGGKRAGATTAAANGFTTACPLYGSSPEANGECSDAQWKVQGTPDEVCPARKKNNGSPCAKNCDCNSSYCKVDEGKDGGTCADRRASSEGEEVDAE